MSNEELIILLNSIEEREQMKKELEKGIAKDKERIKEHLINNNLKELNIENFTAKIYDIDKSEINEYKLIELLKEKGLTDAITTKTELSYKEDLVCKYVIENIINREDFINCITKNITKGFRITKH